MNEAVVKNKRPFGFYVCCIVFMLERMAYYSAKYLIFVFVSATIMTGGLGLTKVQAALIQSNLVAFTYLAPVFGGYLADRYIGARYCIPVGLGLMSIGYFLGGSATSVVGMNLMVAFVAIGTGLFKGEYLCYYRFFYSKTKNSLILLSLFNILLLMLVHLLVLQQ